MASDLVRIVKDTESSLANKPLKYSTQLELFIGSDEKILAEFFRRERDDKPHYLRHKEWEVLVGKPEKYQNPKKYMKKQRQNFPETEKKIREALAAGTLLEMGVSYDTITLFGDLPAMAYRMLDMETRLYESVVAYAKQISDEKGIKPADAVKSPECRDEIYRRIFSTREQFEWYNNTCAKMGITALGMVYSLLKSLEPKIKEAENTPIVGWFVKRKMDKALKQLPPKAVVESFLREEIAYDAQMAQRIYGDKPGNRQAIDAEVVE